MAGKRHRDPWGIEVPGGFVTTEPRRAMFSARGFEQDIVVKDGPHGQALFREGPFDNITVQRPMKRIAAEIEVDG